MAGPKRKAGAGADGAEQVTRYHVVLFQADGNDSIDRGTVRDIQHQLDKEVRTPPESTEIDVWIDSPGGDSHSAYKLNLELRSRCRLLRAVVPDYAKSAATLLALGSDEIYMASAAELGPLDVQIAHPSREDLTVSGLDVAGSFEFIGQTAIGLMVAGGASVIKTTGLSRTEVLKSMTGFCASLMEPVVAKLDPHLVHRAASQLRVAEHYARAMLRARANRTQLSDEAIRKLIRKLVSEYPAHGFVISRAEAETLGLPVRPADKHPRWDFIRGLHQQAEGEEKSFVFVVHDSALDADAPPAKDGGGSIDADEASPESDERTRDGSAEPAAIPS